MKVAHIINTFPGYHARVGGGEQAALRLIRKLAREGIENEIYTFFITILLFESLNTFSHYKQMNYLFCPPCIFENKSDYYAKSAVDC